MKKYRILITISEFMYSSQVRNIYDLVSLIDRDKFDVEIGALATNDEAQHEVENLGIKIYRLRLQPTRGFTLLKFLDLCRGPFIIAFKRYDLVHSLLYQSFFTEPLFFKMLTKAKYVYTKSNLEWGNHPLNWGLKTRLADKVISISSATDKLLDAKGFGEKKVKVFLGIDTDHFKHSPESRGVMRKKWHIPDSATVFGCAAQFIELKEHLTVLRAFEKIAPGNPDIYLIFCGPDHQDDYYFSIVTAVSQSPFRDRIVLLGTQVDMPAFYSAIDIFVLVSRIEAFGYVYVEAMSCGLPVIGCRAAGPMDIIEDNKTGYFAKMSDSVDLAIQMNKYLMSPDLVQEHGVSGRARAKELFSKESMARKTQELYLEMLQGGA